MHTKDYTKYIENMKNIKKKMILLIGLYIHIGAINKDVDETNKVILIKMEKKP